MKVIYIAIMLFFGFFTNAQTYAKFNTIPALLGIPNVGIETKVGEKQTFQFDIFASLWKSIDGKPTQFYIFIPEYRYHFLEVYNGFYVGANLGFTLFNFQKYSSFNSGQYQKGFGYLIGATVGYQKKVNERFNLDFYIGGGHSEGFYKGYFIDSGIRYDSPKDYNRSGEWIPYRGGIMLSYRLK
jgi:hypothetical protein